MATAKEFIARIDEIDGVAGCVLLREDGSILGGSLDDPDLYTPLMVLGGVTAHGIKDKVGFTYCRHLSFNRAGKDHFHLFPIDKFFLGVSQSADCFVPDMLQAVLRLIGRVTTGGTSAEG
ncbi:MAG: hypothetical protein L3J63_09345 [Geopsychrobacter sp.]|nr:hypothetical protein [Geopsychrobacter sp.]